MKLYFDDPEVMLPFAHFRFHFIGRIACYFYNASEGILFGGASFQADGHFIGTDGFVDLQVHIAQALFCIATPHQRVVCINL